MCGAKYSTVCLRARGMVCTQFQPLQKVLMCYETHNSPKLAELPVTLETTIMHFNADDQSISEEVNT